MPLDGRYRSAPDRGSFYPDEGSESYKCQKASRSSHRIGSFPPRGRQRTAGGGNAPDPQAWPGIGGAVAPRERGARHSAVWLYSDGWLKMTASETILPSRTEK